MGVSGVSYKALGRAVERLRESLARFEANQANDLTEALRDSVLMSFQITYGLCRPMMERFLISDGADPAEVEEMSLGAIVRTCNEKGVLKANWSAWQVYREARNRMAHVYSESFAKQIVEVVPAFLQDVQELYQQLVRRVVEE